MKTETPEKPEAIAVTGTPEPDDKAREQTPPTIHLKNILVPLEFSEMSFKSLQYAVPFARQCGATLTLLHVVAPSDHILDFSYPVPLEEKRIAEIEKQLEDLRVAKIPPELSVNTIVRQGRPFATILELAREIRADLIITATHGRTGVDHLLLGSTAENVARGAACPVLVIREQEHDLV